MTDEPARGTLHPILRPGQASPAEAHLPFETLEELLDLRMRHQTVAALGRVEIRSGSGGQTRRLVLDFGQCSAWND